MLETRGHERVNLIYSPYRVLPRFVFYRSSFYDYYYCLQRHYVEKERAADTRAHVTRKNSRLSLTTVVGNRISNTHDDRREFLSFSLENLHFMSLCDHHYTTLLISVVFNCITIYHCSQIHCDVRPYPFWPRERLR